MTSGPVTADELREILAACCPGREPQTGTGAENCLGLLPHEFERVVRELERRLCMPLLLEALRCRTAAELVSYVNSQATSAA